MRIKQTLLLLLFASLLLLCGSVSAQTSTQMIQLDQSSFRPTYTDALTGVNIDPIGKDSSRRPCARIKVHVNRMTREDINQIELRIVTNNEQIKCKTADYDNGLIIELTAKPDTRFYFHHDKFGDSNEVLVNLEADKEYRMEAFLNILYPITVQSNASDVEVYIDENFVGVTGENRRLGIQEVLPGKHHLYCRRGDIRSAGQEIFVSAGDTFFVENIDIEASQPQYVVFSVEPKNAVVEIDSQQYVPEDGAVMAVLPSGVYNYSVTARGYHPQSGTFTVAGAKVERAVTLVSDAAKVTLAASDGAEIYVNGKRVGEGRWSGELISGTYIFEARKSGHRTQTLSKEIASTPTSQSYTLPACTPIYGGVDIISTPIMADIAIDGKTVGRTPLKLDNILAGAHTVTISKGGYKSHTQSITVADDKVITMDVALTPTASTSAKLAKQETVKSVKSTKPIKPTKSLETFRTPKYQNNIDLGYTLHPIDGSFMHHYDLNYIGGVRIKRIFVGLGLGAEYSNDNIDNDSSLFYHGVMSAKGFCMPIYLHLRTYLGQRSRTFFSLSAGGKFFGSSSFIYGNQAFKYNTNGVFAGLNFGLNFGKFYLSAGASLQSFPRTDVATSQEIWLIPKLCAGVKITTGFTF